MSDWVISNKEYNFLSRTHKAGIGSSQHSAQGIFLCMFGPIRPAPRSFDAQMFSMCFKSRLRPIFGPKSADHKIKANFG